MERDCQTERGEYWIVSYLGYQHCFLFILCQGITTKGNMLLTEARQSPTLTDKRSLNARESATRVRRGEISLSLRWDICYPAWKAPALSRSSKELPKKKKTNKKGSTAKKKWRLFFSQKPSVFASLRAFLTWCNIQQLSWLLSAWRNSFGYS